MKITKIRESIVRVYNTDEGTDRIENQQFEITDDEGRRVGDATTYIGGYTISMTGASNTVDEGLAAIKKLLNITE